MAFHLSINNLARVVRELVLAGRALAPADFVESRLYAEGHHHVLRPRWGK